MSEDKIKQIENHIMQCVGALTNEIEYEGSKAKHLIVAELSKICLEICKSQDKYNMFVGKPIMRATIHLLQDRLNGLKKIDFDFQDKHKFIEQYELLIKSLTTITESIKEESE